MQIQLDKLKALEKQFYDKGEKGDSDKFADITTTPLPTMSETWATAICLGQDFCLHWLFTNYLSLKGK